MELAEKICTEYYVKEQIIPNVIGAIGTLPNHQVLHIYGKILLLSLRQCKNRTLVCYSTIFGEVQTKTFHARILTDGMEEFWLLRKDGEFPDLLTSEKLFIKQGKKLEIDFAKILDLFLKELQPYRGCKSICQPQCYQINLTDHNIT